MSKTYTKVKAKFPGKCAMCNGSFEPGQKVQIHNKLISHIGCEKQFGDGQLDLFPNSSIWAQLKEVAKQAAS